MEAQVTVDLRSRGRWAVALSAAIPISIIALVCAVALTGMTLLLLMFPLLIAGLMQLSRPSLRDFDAVAPDLRSNFLASARPYLRFNAARGGIPLRLAVAVVWVPWGGSQRRGRL